MTHRQTPQNRLYARMKRMNAKAFNAFLPEPLHAILRKHAARVAELQGGHANINKIVVKALLEQYEVELTDAERSICAQFLENA